MAIVISRLPIDLFKQLAFPAYAGILALLVLVELIGAVGGGSQRWLNLGFIHLQPSELMKLAIVLAVARFYTILPAGEIRKWTAIWPMLVLIGVPAFLILIQPDLGTATTVVVGGVTVAFLAGLPLRLFIGSGLAVTAALPVAFSFLHEDRSEEHTSELQSLMRNSYAVFCLKKKKYNQQHLIRSRYS